MLVNEAQCLGAWIAAQPSTTLFPLCNIDSGSRRLRTQQQPWLERFVFGPARVRGEVVHVDRAAAEGVDVVANPLDARFIEDLGRQFRTVIGANVLQHSNDIPTTCARLWDAVCDGGHLVLTSPFDYPRLDSRDNGLRPRPEHVAAWFPSAVVVEQRIVEDYTLARYVFRTPWHVLEELVQTVSTARRQHWSVNLTRWAWLRRPFSVSVVVLAKPTTTN